MNAQTPKRRKDIRLPGHDYRRPGAYFITICTTGMRSLFGTITESKMHPNALGLIVRDEWLRAGEVRENIELDAFVVMPNHFHGILLINAPEPALAGGGEKGATHRVAGTAVGQRHRRRGSAANSVGSIVGQFKSHSSRRINRQRGTPGSPVWKPNYYEHIIRSERSLIRIREYIECNPGKWHEDRYFVGEAVLV